MGLDGGTYITRSDVLRGQCWDLSKADNSRSTRGGAVQGTHKRAKLDAKVARRTKWTTCSLSEEALKAPIVADFLGNLYNRAAVLEFLLGRGGHFADAAAEHRFINRLNATGSALDHLQSRRDVFEIRLDGNAAQSSAPDGQARSGDDVYCCPLTDLPCDTHPFSALTICGHVLSDRALQQMAERSCGICSQHFGEHGIVPINGTAEQLQDLRQKLEAQKARKASKKLKRRREQGAESPSLSEAPVIKTLRGAA